MTSSPTSTNWSANNSKETDAGRHEALGCRAAIGDATAVTCIPARGAIRAPGRTSRPGERSAPVMRLLRRAFAHVSRLRYGQYQEEAGIWMYRNRDMSLSPTLIASALRAMGVCRRRASAGGPAEPARLGWRPGSASVPRGAAQDRRRAPLRRAVSPARPVAPRSPLAPRRIAGAPRCAAQDRRRAPLRRAVSPARTRRRAGAMFRRSRTAACGVKCCAVTGVWSACTRTCRLCGTCGSEENPFPETGRMPRCASA